MSVCGTVTATLALEVFLGSVSIIVDLGRSRGLLPTSQLVHSGFAKSALASKQRS